MTQQVFLMVGRDESDYSLLPLPGPGGQICFMVGKPDEPHSGIWVVKSPNYAFDVYAGSLSAMDNIKVSLHASGDWRYALVQEHARITLRRGVSRIQDQWNRPAEIIPGWTEGLDIWFSHDDLSLLPTGHRPNTKHFVDACPRDCDIVKLPAPSADCAVGVHVLLGRANQGFANFGGYVPFGGFSLLNGGLQNEPDACILATSTRKLSQRDIQFLQTGRADTVREAEDHGTKLGQEHRGWLFGHSPRQTRTYWDITLRR